MVGTFGMNMLRTEGKGVTAQKAEETNNIEVEGSERHVYYEEGMA
jgi:hypothetical protein